MRRYLSIGLTAGSVAIAAVLAGAPAFAQDINISFRFNDPEVSEMRAALDEFERLNPGVKVELQTISWGDARAQFLREAAVGEGPDVVHIAFVWPKDMGNAGALMPLNDFINATSIQAGFDDFIATELAIGDDGEIFGTPWTTDTWAMIYRSDLLAAAGVDKIPATWDELRGASRAVFEKTGKIGFGIPEGSRSGNSIWFLSNYYWWSNGRALVVEDGQGGFTTDISVDDIADTWRYFKSYIDEGHTPESYLGVSDWFDPAIMNGLVEGEQAIAIMPPATFRRVLANFKERNPGVEPPFVTATTPGGVAGPKTHLGGRMLGINANTEHPDVAWKLVQFLTEGDTLTKYYENQFPAQRALLQKVEFGPTLEGFAEQLQLARTWGAYADGPAQIGSMWDEAGRQFGSAAIGEKSFEEAAADFLGSIKEALGQ